MFLNRETQPHTKNIGFGTESKTLKRLLKKYGDKVKTTAKSEKKNTITKSQITKQHFMRHKN